MITYSTNWMGPINSDWIKEHGDCWAAGRIDIYGVPDEPYPIEYSLPVMNSIDWEDFSKWLDDLETEELLSLEGILEKYFVDTGRIIRWWKEKNTCI